MKFFILYSPILFYVLAILFKSWIIFIPTFYWVFGLFLILFSLFYKKQIYKHFSNVSSNKILILFFILILFLPVRNLKLGDGILILESVFIESKLLGFQLVMDEFLTTFIHSKFFLLTEKFLSVRQSYSLLSYFFGFLCLILIKKFSIIQNPFQWMVIIFSGGFFVFQGYVENYSIPQFFLLFVLIYGYSLLKRDQLKLINLLILSFLSCLAALSHLVNGYMILGLIFIVSYRSSIKTFLQKSILCCIFTVSILLFFFIWFKYFSEVRIETNQTHFFNPPFYPLRKIFSINHLKQIFQVLLFSAFLPITIFVYFYCLKRKVLNEICKKPESKFLLWIFFGFFIHLFIFDPKLGFPADWDIASFFYFPLVLFSATLWEKCSKKEQVEFVPIFVFYIFIYVGNSFVLNHKNQKDEIDLEISMKIAQNYIQERELVIQTIKAENKKNFIQMDYFLYKKFFILDSFNDLEAKQLMGSITKFQKQLIKIDSNEEKNLLFFDLIQLNNQYTKYMKNK